MIEPFPAPIYLTKPLLPGLDDMNEMLRLIWESNQLTNNGIMVQSLEKKLADYLNVGGLSLFANGTVALQLACKVLKLSGEVITTPFTFAATIHALAWNNIKPVFCDIEEGTYNIDPDRIEDLITGETSAILPVHVYGYPCRVVEIQQIADIFGLKVLYDAAHAFGVKINGRSLAAYGDISMYSLHATKVYHTIEGGALAFNKPLLKERADTLRNFGLQSDGNVSEPGANGKMHEVEAAVGLLLIDKVDEEIRGRKAVSDLYRKLVAGIPGLAVRREEEGIYYNYPYFTVRVDEKEYGLSRDALAERLREYNVISRKYFYPLCSNLQCYKDLPSAAKSRLPVANAVADTILALPIHGRMPAAEVEKICEILAHVGRRS